MLAAAGAVFDRSLDPRQTMRAIAATAVPRLAEMCVINLLREDGTIGLTVAVAVREEAVRRLEELRASQPIDLAGENPVARALRSREPVVIHDLTDKRTVEETEQSEEYRELIAWSGYRSAVVMPLIARGRLLGALSFLYVHDGRRSDPDHLSLMREVASRAAMAIDNANLYVEREHVAHTLQLSLLPETLPSVEGVALSCAYHPAGEVGGDFYDVFTAPSGCWLVVGDVCGKGPEAAAVTALVRHSIRALAFVRSSPAQVLGTVNEVMLGHELSSRFATAVVARLDLSTRPARAVIAAAGHPPPVVLGADGSVSCPRPGGMLLGVRRNASVFDVEVELEPGAALVLYTDGLLDAGAPARGMSTQELCDRLEGHARLSPQAIVQELERLALSSGAGRLRDDVAILVARVED